jgi:toxin-antitoxin system PIN domain toxin
MKRGSSNTLLLDVNVLLALAWPHHQFFPTARKRLESHRGRWATCALTELGFIRLSANPRVVGQHRTPADAAGLLAVMTADPKHVYIEVMPSPVEATRSPSFNSILGHRQVTDLYLLGLAERNHARLVTFDSRIRELAGDGDRVEVLSVPL